MIRFAAKKTVHLGGDVGDMPISAMTSINYNFDLVVEDMVVGV
jgi:hypothetical protein